jgi:glucose/arabinose dehydrogenase
LGIGGIVRMDPFDGSGRQVYSIGMRNSVGQDFNPKDGTLWWTDNQTDGLGNEIPPGELNRSTKKGEHFGYPYWNGKFKVAGSSAAPDLKDMKEPANAVFPQIEFPAHQAQLGMTFYTGKQFPAMYRGGIFVASHGSWNRSPASGALINFFSLKADGTADKSEVFAEGWLSPETGTYKAVLSTWPS